jgi:hypothetical protein
MRKLDIKELSNKIKNQGYIRIPNYISSEESDELVELMGIFNDANYTQSNLYNRLCYKREESNNRQGDAYMVGVGDYPLQSIQLSNPLLIEMYSFYNSLCEELVGVPQLKGSRCMLNCQQYFNDSFEVIDHYDGEFFDFEHINNGKFGEYALKINKGLLPRYVMVVVLYNENTNGTYIRHHNSEERIDIPNEKYDLIIFDNIKMRHGVPKLEHPRMMIGFRNFDYYPYLFESNKTNEFDWIKLDDKLNSGYIRELTELESIKEQENFLKVWKLELYEEQLNKKVAF